MRLGPGEKQQKKNQKKMCIVASNEKKCDYDEPHLTPNEKT